METGLEGLAGLVVFLRLPGLAAFLVGFEIIHGGAALGVADLLLGTTQGIHEGFEQAGLDRDHAPDLFLDQGLGTEAPFFPASSPLGHFPEPSPSRIEGTQDGHGDEADQGEEEEEPDHGTSPAPVPTFFAGGTEAAATVAKAGGSLPGEPEVLRAGLALVQMLRKSLAVDGVQLPFDVG